MTSQTRLILLAPHGFLGARAAENLRRINVDVTDASRGLNALLRLDLTNPTTFHNLPDDPIAILNCADSISAPPIDLARYCLDRGHTLLETSADPGTIRALHDLRDAPNPRGAVVLGVGLFPGISNLLAAAAHDRRPGARRLEIAVRHDVLTQAGRGTCRIMAGALAERAQRYQDGVLTLDAPIGPLTRFDFGDPRPNLAVRVGLPESLMLHWSRGVPTTASYFASRSALQARATALGRAMPTRLARTGAAQRMMTASLTLCRRILFARRLSHPSVAARAADDSGAITGVLHFQDAFEAAGAAIAAITTCLLHRDMPRGVLCIDQVLTLQDVLSELDRLGGPCPVDWID